MSEHKSATSIPCIRHWQSAHRVYAARLDYDLLGDLVLVTEWGGRASHLGGSKIELVGSMTEGMKRLEALDRRRQVHGYVRCS